MNDIARDVTVMVTRNGLGHADETLGHKLAGSYFDLLDLEDRLPGHVCFYGEGVKLVCEGSPVLETLTALAERGVALLVCSTCLTHYDLERSRRVGTVSNMRDIQAAQWDAARVLAV